MNSRPPASLLPRLNKENGFSSVELIIWVLIAGIVFLILVTTGPATNYIPLFIVLGLIAFLVVAAGSLVLAVLSSNQRQFKKATKLFQKMKDGKVTPVEVNISDFAAEGRRTTLQMAIDMGLSLYKVNKKTLFIGHSETSGVHEHDRWYYIVKAQGLNNQYFRILNGKVEKTTIHYVTLKDDLEEAKRVQSYINDQGVTIALSEVTKMARLCNQGLGPDFGTELTATTVMEVQKTGLPAWEVHDLQHHFEEVTTIKPEFQSYKDLPQELALKICNLPTENVNKCGQRI